MDSQEKKGGRPHGVPNKQQLYSAAAAHALQAIKILAVEMVTGDNSAARIGAAKALLSKCLPDLKSQDFTDGEGKSLIEKIIIVRSDENPIKPLAG